MHMKITCFEHFPQTPTKHQQNCHFMSCLTFEGQGPSCPFLTSFFTLICFKTRVNYGAETVNLDQKLHCFLWSLFYCLMVNVVQSSSNSVYSFSQYISVLNFKFLPLLVLKLLSRQSLVSLQFTQK